MQVDWNALISTLAALSPIWLALLGGLGWLYKHEREKRESAEHQISENKHRAYIALLDIFFDMMKATKAGKSINDVKLMDRMTEANKELILYGSDDVVRIFQKYIANARRGETSLEEFGELIVAIRRDMGHRTTKIRPEEVLRQIIIDYDEAKTKGELVIQSGKGK